MDHLRTLYAQSRRITLAPPVLPRLLAQELAGTYCLEHVIIFSKLKDLQYAPSSLIRYCWIKLSLIVQYSSLLPSIEVWAVSQSQCGCSISQNS